MVKRDIVVIGSSAGGVVALKELVAALPADCKASFFVVQHVSANGRSILPTILSHAGPLQAKYPPKKQTDLKQNYVWPLNNMFSIRDLKS